MATPINAPRAGEIWHLSIEDLFQPVQEALRLGGNGPFVINLSASTAPISIPTKAFTACRDAHVYQIQVTEDGRTRYRLRLGPFLGEDEADAVLAEVRDTYPGALTATAGAADLRVIANMQAKADARQPVARAPAQKTAAEKIAAIKLAAVEPTTEGAEAEISIGMAWSKPHLVVPPLPAPRAAAAEKAAAEKAAAEKAAAEKAAAEKAEAEKAEAEKAAAQKAAAEKAAMEKAAAEKAAMEKAAVEKAAVEKAAMEKAAMEKAAAQKAAMEKAAATLKAPTEKPMQVLRQSIASPLKAFAKKMRPSAIIPPTRLTSLQHVVVATAPVPAAREVKKLDEPLDDLESTQTMRALTATELEDTEASRWFVIQLAAADRAFDPDAVPNLDIFSEYRLYSVAGSDQGRIVHALRLGFFREEIAAVAVASYLGAFWDKPTIKRVSLAERERFADQRVEARKDVGATGMHAVIEITDELVARRRRASRSTAPSTTSNPTVGH
jgi:chemotaxis protein histidine kinase CheA